MTLEGISGSRIEASPSGVATNFVPTPEIQTASVPLPHEGAIYTPDQVLTPGLKPFSEIAEAQARNIDLTEALKGRPDVSGITIDNIFTQDRDDGFELEREGGGFLLHVSIADPTAVIPLGSPIDLESRERAFARYYGESGNDPMIPRILAEDRLSLNEGERRPTITMTIPLSSRVKPGEPVIRRTAFTSRRALSYPEADRIIRENSDPEAGMLRDAMSLASILAEASGREYDPDHRLRPSERGVMVEAHSEDAYWAYEIISEFMKAANKGFGRIAARLEADGVPQVYRTHLNLDNYAFYTTYYRGHLGLGLDHSQHYAHSTSPGRREADQLLHRQLEPALTGGSPAFLDSRDLEELVVRINRSVKEEKDRFDLLKNINYKIMEDERIRRAIATGESLDGRLPGRVVKVSMRDGVLDKTWPWLLPRIEGGEITAKTLLPLIFSPPIDDFTNEKVDWILTEFPFTAREALEIFCREREMKPPTFREYNGRQGEMAYRATARVSYKSERIVGRRAHGPDRGTSRARASASVIRVMRGDSRFTWH